ncbi:hypothetical protein A0Z39_07320 [Campylobacter lari]|nr:hypothetical protein [Campylobacter lari]
MTEENQSLLDEQIDQEDMNNSLLDEVKICNYQEIIDEQIKILEIINNTINIGLNNVLDENTKEGIFKDLEQNFYKLKMNIDSLISYFKNPPSQEELEIINKTLLIKTELDSLNSSFSKLEIEEFSQKAMELKTALDNSLVNFDNTFLESLNSALKVSNDDLKDFRSKTEARLSDSLQTYDQTLKVFLEKEKNAILDFSKIFSKLTKNIKQTMIVSLMFFALFGFSFGVFSFIVYLKYEDYKKITQNAQKLSSIIIKENKDKSLTLSFPKNKTILNKDENGIHITLQGGE